MSVALGGPHRRRLGWTVAAAGVGLLAGGALTAHGGLSAQASTVLLGPLRGSLMFLLGDRAAMWRDHTPDQR